MPNMKMIINAVWFTKKEPLYLKYDTASNCNRDHTFLDQQLLAVLDNPYNGPSHEEWRRTNEFEITGVDCSEIDVLVNETENTLEKFLKLTEGDDVIIPVYLKLHLQIHVSIKK